MNESRSESFQLKEDGAVVVSVVHLAGELDINITDSSGTAVLLIVLPAVATILVGVLHGIFNLTQIEAADVGNGTSVMMGIMLIFVSLILRYGVDLEGNNDAR